MAVDLHCGIGEWINTVRWCDVVTSHAEAAETGGPAYAGVQSL